MSDFIGKYLNNGWGVYSEFTIPTDIPRLVLKPTDIHRLVLKPTN